MTSYFVKKTILKFLSKYVYDDFKLDINLFSSGNTVELENVRLREDCIPSSLPVKLHHGVLGRVVIQLPLFQLSSKPTHIYIDELSVVLVIKEENDISRDDILARLESIKTNLRESVESCFRNRCDKIHLSTGEGNGGEDEDEDEGEGFEFPWMPGFVKNMIRMFRLQIDNVHIRFEMYKDENDGFIVKGKRYNDTPRCDAIGLSFQMFSVDTYNKLVQAIMGYPASVYGEDFTIKAARLSRLGVYVDVNAPRTEQIPKITSTKSNNLVPGCLETYQNHTWVVEPFSIIAGIVVSSLIPKKGTPWKPTLESKIYITKVAVNVHPTTCKVLLYLFRDINNWHVEMDNKAMVLDAQYSKVTMSVAEHAERSKEYEDLYLLTIRTVCDNSRTKRHKARAIRILRRLESIVHTEDLFSIWQSVLRRPELLELSRNHFVSTCKSDLNKHVHRSPNVPRTHVDTHGNVEVLSQSVASSNTSSVARANFIRMLTVSQIYDGSEEAARQDDDDDDYEEMNENLISKMFVPSFDFVVKLERVEVNMALAHQSSSALHFSLDYTHLRLCNFHTFETNERAMSHRMLVVRVLESRGVRHDPLATRYLTVSNGKQENQSDDMHATGANPVFNYVCIFDATDEPGDFTITLWLKKALTKPVQIGQTTIKVAGQLLRDSDKHEWASLGPGRGFLKIAFGLSAKLHKLPEVFTRNQNTCRHRWPKAHPLNFELCLGAATLKCGIHLNAARGVTSPPNTPDTVVYVNLIHLETDSHMIVSINQRELERFLSYATSLSRVWLYSGAVTANMFVDFAPLHALISRWQLMFILQKISDNYVGPLIEMFKSCAKDPYTTRLEDFLLNSSNPSCSSMPGLGHCPLKTEDETLGPFYFVTSQSIPVKLVANFIFHEIDCGFTWGSGSAEITQDSGKLGNTDHITSHVVGSMIKCFVGSHVEEPDGQIGLRVELSVGALGILDDSATYRPVVYASPYRNTNFAAQAAQSSKPVLKVKLSLPFGWAFHLNFHNRRAIPIPDAVSSRLKVDVEMDHIVVEAPAIFFVALPILGGIMPLSKLIEIPPFPSIAVQSVLVNINITDLQLVAMETLDPVYGTRGILMTMSFHTGFQSFAHRVADSVIADFSVSIGVCTLLEGRKNHRLAKASSAAYCGPEFESVAHACANHFSKDVKPFWKETHKMLVDFSIESQLGIKPPQGTPLDTNNCDRAVMFVSFKHRPCEMLLWLDDMALCFRIMTNFLNDGTYLSGSLVEMVGFELPPFAWSSSTTDAEGGKNAPQEALARTPSIRFTAQKSVRGSMRSLSTPRSSLSEQEPAQKGLTWTRVVLALAQQDILLLDYQVSEFRKVEYEVVDDPTLDVSIIMGYNDIPVCRGTTKLDFVFMKSVLHIAMHSSVWYYNRKFSDWEPIVEPWDAQIQFLLAAAPGQLMKLKGISFSSKQVAEIDLSQAFFVELMDLAIQCTQMLDQNDLSHSAYFYPRIEQPAYSSVPQYELCNFTGETLLFQLKRSPVKMVYSEASLRDDELNCEAQWSLSGDFKKLSPSEVTDIDFPVLHDPDVTNPRLFVKIMFEKYDQSFMSYLVRVDRIGDYAIALGNGNVLRVSITTKDGYRKSVMFLAAVSMVNHTSEDVVLTRETAAGEALHRVLRVNSTLFVPITMTDNKLGLKYYVNSKQDYAYFQGTKMRFRNTVEEDNRNALRLVLNSLPVDEDADDWLILLSSRNLLCAVQVFTIPLKSMAFNNYNNSGGDTEFVSVSRKIKKAIRPRWSRHLKDMDENRARLYSWRKNCMRAIQVVLKPLVAFDNELPVPLLALPVHFDGSIGKAELISAGGRMVVHDRVAHALQFKIPSENTEWSVPIPIYVLASPYVRKLMEAADDHFIAFRGINDSSAPPNEAFGRMSRFRTRSEERPKQLAAGVRSQGTYISLYKSIMQEVGGLTDQFYTAGHAETEEGLLPDGTPNFSSPNWRQKSIPLARRMTVDCSSTVLPEGFHWLSFRVIAAQHMIQFAPNKMYKITIQFRDAILGTAPGRPVLSVDSTMVIFEQFVSFSFPLAACGKSKAQKIAYMQLIEMIDGAPPRIACACKIELSHMLFDFYLRGGRKAVRRVCRDIPMFSVLNNLSGLDDSSLSGQVDFDIRASPSGYNIHVPVTDQQAQEEKTNVLHDIDEYLRESEEDNRTDMEEFDIISDMSGGDPDDPPATEAESIRLAAQNLWSKVRYTRQMITQMPGSGKHPAEMVEVDHFVVNYANPALLAGLHIPDILNISDWNLIARHYDQLRQPCHINFEQISANRETGFKVILSPQKWIANETSVDMIIQQFDNSSSCLDIIPPSRVKILNDFSPTARVAFYDRNDHVLSSVHTVFTAESVYSLDVMCKGEQQGRAMVWHESYSIGGKLTKVIPHAGMKINHSLYIANTTEYIVEVRQADLKRNLGRMLVDAHTEKFVPYRYRVQDIQFRLRRLKDEESGLLSDWSGIINLKSNTFSQKHDSLPVAFYDTDGNFVECLQVEVYNNKDLMSKGSVSLLGTNTVRTTLIRIKPDKPITYVISNMSSRMIIVDQLESTDMSPLEYVIVPHDEVTFGWAQPSEDHKRVRVRMVLKPEEKLKARTTDDFRIEVDMEKVGKVKTVGIDDFRVYARIDINHTTRNLIVTCEQTENVNSVDPTTDMQLMEGSRRNLLGVEEHKSIIDCKYMVCVRIFSVRKVSNYTGGANLFVRLKCSSEEKISNAGITGDDPAIYTWSDTRYYFKYDLFKPRYIDFMLLVPKPDGEKMDGGQCRVNIHDEFPDDEGLKRLPPQYVRLRNSSLPAFKKAELQFELYLVSGPGSSSDDNEGMRAIQMKLPGLGLSIINSRRRQEDLYCRLSGILVNFKETNGTFSLTLRIQKLQIDNYQPHVQDRVCIVPRELDIPMIELNAILSQVNKDLVAIESLDVLVQSFLVKIDENFLDAIFGLVQPVFMGYEVVAKGAFKALRLVYGGFEGKRKIRYQMEDDNLSGETFMLVSDARQNVVSYSIQHSSESNVPTVQSEIPTRIFKVYLKEAHIYPVHVVVSFFFNLGEGGTIGQYQKGVWFKGVISGFTKWSEVSFRISEYHGSDKYGTVAHVTKDLRKQLFREAGLQSWKGIGALNILGNPQALVERILGSIVVFCVSLPAEYRLNGIGAGFLAATDSTGHMVCVFVSAPVQFAGRITGSVATIFEGTRPIRHLGKPLRLITTGLEFVVQGTDFIDPLLVTYFPIRKPRKFVVDRCYTPLPIEGATVTPEEVVVEINTDNLLESEESLARHRNVPPVADIFNPDDDGLTDEGKARNKKNQFHVNHQLHCCLLCIPGFNFFWIFIYALHLVGILQWF